MSVCFNRNKKTLIYLVYNMKASKKVFLDSESGLTISANCTLLAHRLRERQDKITSFEIRFWIS